VRSCRPEVVEMEIPFVHRMRFSFTFQPRRLSTLLLTVKRCTTLWALNKFARSLPLPRRGPVLGWVAGSCLHSTASRLHTAPTLSFTCGCQRCYRHGDLVSPRYQTEEFSCCCCRCYYCCCCLLLSHLRSLTSPLLVLSTPHAPQLFSRQVFQRILQRRR
jgi:hypothetical protein